MLDGVNDNTNRARALDARQVGGADAANAPPATPASSTTIETPAAAQRAPVNPAAQRDARAAQAERERATAARVSGPAAASERPIPQLDPNKPVMIVATQSGSDDSNKIVKATDRYMKDQAKKNGFQVVDASNLAGDALKKFVGDVARANPAAFQGKNTVLFTGGHGDIQTNEHGQDRHEIAATEDDHRTTQRETVRDIVKPVFDGIKDATGAEQKLAAFVSSCRSGEAAQDVKEVFGNNPNVGLLASSTRDQNSFGPGRQGIEQAAIAYTKSMATTSKDRAAADTNKDGAVSIGEFAKHWNTSHGGLGFVDPGEDDRAGGPLVKRQQKLVVGGNPDLALVPKGAGADHDTSGDGLKDPKHAGPLQRDQLDAEAKRMQKELAADTGRKPAIAPGFSTVGETGTDGKKRTLADGSEEFRSHGVTETQHPDGAFDVGLSGGDKIHWAPDGTRTETHARGPVASRTVDPNTGHRDIKYRDGTREVREADGSGYFEKNGKQTPVPVKPSSTKALARIPNATTPDGDPTESVGRHGEHIEKWPDGTTLTSTRDKQTIEFPSSSPLLRATMSEATHKETLELRDGPVKSIERPVDGAPGVTTTTYRDNTREVRAPDGKGYFVLPSGKRVTLPIR